jgi:predicted transcriptional regulator
MLDYQARFLEAVEEGRADARRGALLDHDEVVERIERILRSSTKTHLYPQINAD